MSEVVKYCIFLGFSLYLLGETVAGIEHTTP